MSIRWLYLDNGWLVQHKDRSIAPNCLTKPNCDLFSIAISEALLDTEAVQRRRVQHNSLSPL